MGLVPGLYLAWVESPRFSLGLYGLLVKPIAPMAISSLFYVSQIPERWFPGKFDFVGSSHSIWHVAMLASSMYELTAFQQFSEVVSIKQCHRENRIEVTDSLDDRRERSSIMPSFLMLCDDYCSSGLTSSMEGEIRLD
jgi:hypothetical protein